MKHATYQCRNDKDDKSKSKDWKSFNENMEHDVLNKWCDDLIKAMKKEGMEIILLTGRRDNRRPDTIAWLEKHNIEYDALYMRPRFERKEDYIIKKEIYEEQIKDKHDVLFVLEDLHFTSLR